MDNTITIQEVDKTIQYIVDRYGQYMNNIDELILYGYPEDKAKRLVVKKYKEFEVN